MPMTQEPGYTQPAFKRARLLLAPQGGAGSNEHRCKTLISPKWRNKAAGQWTMLAAGPDSQALSINMHINMCICKVPMYLLFAALGGA